MANPMDAPDNIRIAALERKKGMAQLDLMRPGPGTPWEGRGGNLIPAFFATCFMSIFSPARLLDNIRRPENAQDTNFFAICCGFLWSISLLIHMAIYYFKVRANVDDYRVDPQQFWTAVAVVAAALPFAILGLTLAMARLWHRILSHDMYSKAPPVLAQCVFCYMLGPALLSLIPIAGPPLALLSMFIDWNVAGITRLYAKAHAVIISSVLVFGLMLVIIGGGYFIGTYLYSNFVGDSVIYIPQTPVRTFVPTANPQ
jgi:magnesium-transporting ATPase (P-type)